jgi:hypothetical protein
LTSLEYVQVVLKPTVNVHSGRQAEIRSVQEVPNPTAEPGAPETIECGEILTVTPRIEDDSRVALDVTAEMTSLVPPDDTGGTARIRRQGSDTQAVLGKGQTLVLHLEPTAESQISESNVLYLLACPRVLPPTPAAAGMVTATFVETPLVEALKEIGAQTGVKIDVEPKPGSQRVTADLSGVTVRTALHAVLENTPYTFRRQGDGKFLVYRSITLRWEGELREALSELSAQADMPIVCAPEVTHTVVAALENEPLRRALEILLAGTPYILVEKPDYYLVATPAMLENPPEDDMGSHRSRAWEIMGQANCPPLLLGLTQRLAKVLDSSRQDDPVWRDVTNGGTLELEVTVEQGVPGEIILGLFRDARWRAEPVAARRLPGPGKYQLTGLPPGPYQIGAMVGAAPVADALGVHRSWPEPIEIRQGRTTESQVRVSEAFQRRASGWHNRDIARDYLGDWGSLNQDNLVQGQLTGPDGKPIPFGEVMIQGYFSEPRSHMSPRRGTDEEGRYRYDQMDWPYRVHATWREPLPTLFGCRSQRMFYNRVLEGAQRVGFKFEAFPSGTARVKGRVTDQHGRPVEGFFIRVNAWAEERTQAEFWNPDGKYHTYVTYDVPFISDDGSFELGGLPEGKATVDPIPFEYQRYELEWGQEVALDAGQTTKVELELAGKDVYYGRILFPDGSPAVRVPLPWRGAATRVLLTTRGRGRARTIAELDDDGYFKAYFDDDQLDALASGESQLMINLPTDTDRHWETAGYFPFGSLSQNQARAGEIQVARPVSTEAPAAN